MNGFIFLCQDNRSFRFHIRYYHLWPLFYFFQRLFNYLLDLVMFFCNENSFLGSSHWVGFNWRFSFLYFRNLIVDYQPQLFSLCRWELKFGLIYGLWCRIEEVLTTGPVFWMIEFLPAFSEGRSILPLRSLVWVRLLLLRVEGSYATFSDSSSGKPNLNGSSSN